MAVELDRLIEWAVVEIRKAGDEGESVRALLMRFIAGRH